MEYDDLWRQRDSAAGRVYTREQLRYLEGVKGLTPDGRKYIDGKLERVGRNAIVGALLFFGVMLVMFSWPLLSFMRLPLGNNSAAYVFFIVLGIFLLVSMYTVYHAIRSYQRYAREGVHLLGEVLSSRVTERGSGKSRNYVVEVTYTFVTPDGKKLTKTYDLPLRPSLNIFKGGLFASLNERYRDQLIAPKTPVAVLYVDEKLVRLL